MKNKNLYEILGLNSDATKDDIKNSYRKLVRIYHPDINKTKEAETYFKMLNNAVETLLDDTKRLQYDLRAGIFRNKKEYVKKENDKNFNDAKNEQEKEGQNISQTQAKSEFNAYSTYKNTDAAMFFQNKNTENKTAEGFYETKNPKTKVQSAKIDGNDIETTVFISKNEQKQGTIRKINVLHTDKCPKCAGIKYINGTICSLCHGVGEKSEHKIMNVKIPGGIKDGTKMKIKNEGEYGKFGGKNGDLYLLIKIEDKSKESEVKNKIVIETSIPPWKAILGGIIDIPVGNHYVKIEIPPLTKSDTRFKLNKEDITEPETGENSEYIALIKIDIPENLSKKEIELYKKLREIDLGKNL